MSIYVQKSVAFQGREVVSNNIKFSPETVKIIDNYIHQGVFKNAFLFKGVKYISQKNFEYHLEKLKLLF